jgi:osmotically inducible protein OsmC
MKRATFQRKAEVTWDGDVTHGSGRVRSATSAFDAAVTFPTLRGDPESTTTPEELLAASHAACYAIGLRSVIARNGGSAARVLVTATITAEKGPEGIRILGSHLAGTVEQLTGMDDAKLRESADAARRECTISNAIGGAVQISYEVIRR